MSLKLKDKLSLMGVCVSSEVSATFLNKTYVDLEETLVEALVEFSQDARLASLLFSWMKVHGRYVIVEKFSRCLERHSTDSDPGILWAHALAAFAVQEGLHKWKKLAQRVKRPVYLFPIEMTRSAIALKGAISWLEDLNFIVPEGSIRIRESDVMKPEELIRMNRQYRNRYLYGPSWRADIITAIEFGLKTPTQICKLLGCSYEPAYRVLKEYSMATNAT